MRFLCLYKPAKAEGTPPTHQEMAEMVFPPEEAAREQAWRDELQKKAATR